jgi:hypothetical protein
VGIAGIAAAFFAPPWTQRKIERRHEDREFRGAKRLVLHELEVLTLVLPPLVTLGIGSREIVEVTETFRTDAWDENDRVLANALPDVVWIEVTRAYRLVRQLRVVFSTMVEPRSLSTESAERIENVIEAAKNAHQSLRDAKPLHD